MYLLCVQCSAYVYVFTPEEGTRSHSSLRWDLLPISSMLVAEDSAPINLDSSSSSFEPQTSQVTPISSYLFTFLSSLHSLLAPRSKPSWKFLFQKLSGRSGVSDLASLTQVAVAVCSYLGQPSHRHMCETPSSFQSSPSWRAAAWSLSSLPSMVLRPGFLLALVSPCFGFTQTQLLHPKRGVQRMLHAGPPK